jgi:primosomal replication protein N
MAKGFNKVTLMGNLTRDPETRQTPSGQSVTNFSLAVNRTWKGQDGSQQEAVSYIDCVCWGKAGEIIAQYMQKGRPILSLDDSISEVGSKTAISAVKLKLLLKTLTLLVAVETAAEAVVAISGGSN